MQISHYRKYNIVFFKEIIILPIIFFFITSCSYIDNFQKKNIFLYQEKKCKLKKLIIPKNLNFPEPDKEYNIPYTKKELNQKKYSIFPPISY
ncbi:hypothetical protein [Buchnera aphidicola]|uniref:hypothetical protein n=1 Tax=Buchnera aphidicola TaxID=9 RepID=UPI00346430E0